MNEEKHAITDRSWTCSKQVSGYALEFLNLVKHCFKHYLNIPFYNFCLVLKLFANSGNFGVPDEGSIVFNISKVNKHYCFNLFFLFLLLQGWTTCGLLKRLSQSNEPQPQDNLRRRHWEIRRIHSSYGTNWLKAKQFMLYVYILWLNHTHHAPPPLGCPKYITIVILVNVTQS